MTKFSEYASYDGLGLADLIRRRVVSPEEILESAITQIEALNPKINAVIHKLYDQARLSLQQQNPESVLYGVPILLKDLLAELAGAPFSLGSRFTRDWISRQDSELIKRYKNAGVIILGKTNTPELGLSPFTEPVAFGATKNPWDLTRSTGGSSGGSAAAVAAKMVPIAHGGDGAGSLRIPAAYCGVFGLKPSRGRTPVGPNFTRVWQGMVVEHVLTRSVRDSAVMLDVGAAPEVGSPISLPKSDVSFLSVLEKPLAPLKIALIEQPFFSSTVHPEYLAALKKARQLCESLGHRVESSVLKIPSEEVMLAFLTLVAGETAADIRLLTNYFGRKPCHHELELQTAVLARIGESFSAGNFVLANQVLDRVARQVAEFFQEYDVILTPTMPAPPPLLGEFKLHWYESLALECLRWMPEHHLLKKFLEKAGARNFEFTPFTPLFNISGNPAMSMPMYRDSCGLPIGMQFVGRYGEEVTLLKLARQLEAFPCHPERSAPLSS